MINVIFISRFLAVSDAREEVALASDRQTPQWNDHLRKRGKLFWIFGSLLFLGHKMVASAEDIFEPCERSGRPQGPLAGLRVLEFLNSTTFVSIRQIATATNCI
jgi:hypothetical protein